MTIKTWTGEVARPVKFYEPCPCGCDRRDGETGPYISGSNEQGDGFTLRFRDHAEARAFLARAMLAAS